MRNITLEQAKARFPHRFTCEHVPAWALKPMADGRYYAPQYETDQEWFDNTVFPGEPNLHRNNKHCLCKNASFPRGQWLDAPFQAVRS